MKLLLPLIVMLCFAPGYVSLIFPFDPYCYVLAMHKVLVRIARLMISHNTNKNGLSDNHLPSSVTPIKNKKPTIVYKIEFTMQLPLSSSSKDNIKLHSQ